MISEQLENARAEVERLERLALTMSCAERGHPREFVGGRNCGCKDGNCSVPVNSCQCGDSDYGYNEEAVEIIRRCREDR